MLKRKSFFFLLSLFSILISGNAFAGTGGARDGQMMLLVILTFLSLVVGILYFVPILAHQVRNLWKKYRHC